MSKVLTLLAMCLVAFASHADVVQGQDYALLTPARPGSTPGKIEVVEFFSFGCPHCAEFYPSLTQWASKLPKDVALVKVPVSFGRPQWGQLVRAYYAMENTGQLEKLEGPIYRAIHGQNQQLFNEERISAWVSQQGSDAAKFREAFNSFDVSRKASRSEQLSREYNVRSVPQLVVNGKYVVLGKTHEDSLRIASELIEKERVALKASAAQ